MKTKTRACRRRQSQPLFQRYAGLTLIECLITSALMALLLATAMGSLSPLIDRSRVTYAARDFHEAILRARNEAIRRGKRVDLIPAVSQDWSRGWLVLIDQNNNQRFDSGELLIHTNRADTLGLHIDARLRETKKSYLAFDPSGRPRSANSSQVPQTGSLTFSVGAQKRKIIISFLGRVRTCDPNQDKTTC